MVTELWMYFKTKVQSKSSAVTLLMSPFFLPPHAGGSSVLCCCTEAWKAVSGKMSLCQIFLYADVHKLDWYVCLFYRLAFPPRSISLHYLLQPHY